MVLQPDRKAVLTSKGVGLDLLKLCFILKVLLKHYGKIVQYSTKQHAASIWCFLFCPSNA